MQSDNTKLKCCICRKETDWVLPEWIVKHNQNSVLIQLINKNNYCSDHGRRIEDEVYRYIK